MSTTIDTMAAQARAGIAALIEQRAEEAKLAIRQDIFAAAYRLRCSARLRALQLAGIRKSDIQVRPGRQRGHTTLINTALCAALALALCWLGPTVLDGAPDGHGPTYTSYGYAPPQLEDGVAQRLQAEARHRCAALQGENGGYILLADGAIRCATKRGHVSRPAQVATGPQP